MPTTGGLDPDGRLPPDLVAGRAATPKIDPPGKKAEARRLTRVRRFRYYPVRIVDGRIEVALPAECPPRADRGARQRGSGRRSALAGTSSSGAWPREAPHDPDDLVRVVGQLEQVEVGLVDRVVSASDVARIQSSRPAQ